MPKINPIPCPWVLPTKQKGSSDLVWPGIARDALFQKVLVEVGSEQSVLLGRKISPETIVLNCTLYPSMFTRVISAKMKERYKQLKKENRHDKQYLDGIKN